jgi:hypothetical protein
VVSLKKSAKAAPRSTRDETDVAFDRLDYLIRRAGESPRFAARWHYVHSGQTVPCVACLTDKRLLWVVEGQSDVAEVPLEEVVAVVQNEEGWLRLSFEPSDFSQEPRARNPETELHATFFMRDEEKRTLYDALVRESRILRDSRARLDAYEELEGVPAQTGSQVPTMAFDPASDDLRHSPAEDPAEVAAHRF